MGIATIILGNSGRGKSTSLRNLNPADCVLIQVVDKPLPFRKMEGLSMYSGSDWEVWSDSNREGSRFVTDNQQKIMQILTATKKRKIIIIDDFQYLMSNEFMRRSSEIGYTKFTEIARKAWEILMQASLMDPDMRIYIMWHEDQDDFGNIKVKTIGKLLNEKSTPEGLVSICLRAVKNDSGYFFQTQSSGSDPCKSPMGMFAENCIENDLKHVDNTICEYYGIGTSR